MILAQLHLDGTDDEWSEKATLIVQAEFNKLPSDITAENIIQRQYRAWLLQLTDRVNRLCVTDFDVLDVTLKLQRLRKMSKLARRYKREPTGYDLTNT